MKTITLAAALLLVTGCASSLDIYTLTEPEPAWPVLTIREHPDELGFCWEKMPAWRKVLSVALLAPPSGCSWINLCDRTCDVYYPSHTSPCPWEDWGCMGAAAVREHELAHCKGGIHPSDLDNPHYAFWKNGGCNE